MKRIKLLSMMILFCFSMQAQHRITGKVTDTEKKPIPGASVVFTRNDSLQGMTLTNKDGKYSVSDFKKGEYLMSISLIGYTPITEKVFVTKNMDMDFTLAEEMSGVLDEVTITADRSNIVKTNPKGNSFFLSSKAQDAMNIYGALSEIPMLKVDEVEHTISTAFGGQVMILINGVPRGNVLESIDPKDVVSVEVMDTPSARYLAEGYANVINIKTKRKEHKYRLLNLSTEHNPGLYYGTLNGGYELGTNRYSFYVNGKTFYFNNNHYDQINEQRSGDTFKIVDSRGVSDYYSYSVTLGGDWVINDKSYFSYNAALRGIPTEGERDGNGILENGSQTTDYHYTDHTKSSSWVNVYNLYHRYTFSKDATLENSVNFTYNRNDDRNQRREEGTGYFYENLNRNKTKVYKGNYTVTFRKSFGKSALESGNQLRYERMDLEQPSSFVPSDFTHNRWKEYLYADYTYNGNPFSFSVSAGWDMTFNKVEGQSKDYSRLKYNVSLNTKLGNHGGITLFARGYTVDPSSSYLNPYDTSSDSLLIVRGNPSLTPYYYKETGLSANYSFGKFYIWPQIVYSHCSDMITPMGYYDENNIYVSTYGNTEKEESLSARLYTRYNFGKWGEFSYTGSYNRYFFYNGMKDWFSHRISWNFRYRKVSLNGHADITPPTYTAMEKSKSSIEALTTLNWSVSRSLSLRASLRYFMGAKTFQTWTLQDDYYSYQKRAFDERRNMLLLGLNYRWQNKVKARKVKKLNVNDNRVNLLSE